MSVDITPVDLSSAVVDLCSYGQEFFGTEVVRHRPAALEHRLRELEVRPLRAAMADLAIGVAGYAVNQANHRQVTVSVSAADIEHIAPIVRTLVELLRRAARIDSFVAVLRADSPAVLAYRSSGFTEVGRLSARRYRDYLYHDELVLHRSTSEVSDDA
jgi:hypothetical protein